jgi:hypothetical protein
MYFLIKFTLNMIYDMYTFDRVTTFVEALVLCPFCRLFPAKDLELVERERSGIDIKWET